MTIRKHRAVWLAAIAAVSCFAAADTVHVTVNGTPISFPDTQPQTVNGHVLVPLRGVFEALGASVIWDPTTQSILASTESIRVKLRIGDTEANVNDQLTEMDIAPQIVGDSTLVPLRFLSQTLGAKVDWEPQLDLVSITTTGGSMRRHRDGDDHRPNTTQQISEGTKNLRISHPTQPRHDRYLVPSYTVIPVVLDQDVSSDHNQDGDAVTATVRGDRDRYMELPSGALIQGVVRHAHRAEGDHAGTLEIRFTHLLLPDGSRYPISGTVAPLNDPNIVRGDDGRLTAKRNDDVKKSVTQDAAIGAGAGLVLGSLHARALGGAAIGGVLGAVFGALTDHHDNNIHINSGTRLGLIVSKDLSIDPRDLH